jgi:hypothetical protein
VSGLHSVLAIARRIQLVLAHASEAVRSFDEARRDAANRRGRSYALNLLTPILPGHAVVLAQTLRDFGTGKQSPLARLPYVHFARWVIVDQLKTDWEGAPSRPPRLKSQYLLFTADVTAPADADYRLPLALLRDIVERLPEADAVWGNCRGYPGRAQGPDEAVRYLAESRLDTALYFAAYPDATAGEIQAALRVRRGLTEFVQAHQEIAMHPAKLQRAYLKESKRWSRSI